MAANTLDWQSHEYTHAHTNTHTVLTATGAGVAVDTVYPSVHSSSQSNSGINQYPVHTESTLLMCAQQAPAARWVFVEPPGEALKGLTYSLSLWVIDLTHTQCSHSLCAHLGYTAVRGQCLLISACDDQIHIKQSWSMTQRVSCPREISLFKAVALDSPVTN